MFHLAQAPIDRDIMQYHEPPPSSIPTINQLNLQPFHPTLPPKAFSSLTKNTMMICKAGLQMRGKDLADG